MCPFATLLGVGAVATGSERLLVRDLRYRALSWTATALLVAGWVAYFAVLRRHDVRIVLEVLSVVALLAAALRVRALVRSGAVAPLLGGAAGRALAAFVAAIRSPWVAGAKAWLLAMATFQALGRASFSGLEYALASAVLLALIGWRLARGSAPARFGSLERFGTSAPAASCPLGFGCAAAPSAAKSEAAPAFPRDRESRANVPAVSAEGCGA